MGSLSRFGFERSINEISEIKLSGFDHAQFCIYRV